MPTMNVSLTPELEDAVQGFVKKGLFGSQSEVVRTALRLLIERERIENMKLEALRADIALGLEDVVAGRGSYVTADEIIARSRQSRA